MSQYNSASSRQQRCLSVVRQNLPALESEQDALIKGLSSADVSSLSARVDRAAGVEELRALVTEARSLPGFELLAAGLTAPVDQVGQSLAAGGTDVTSGRTALAGALGEVGRVMAQAERLTTAETAAAVLPDLGYTVLRADAAHATAFQASKGHEVLLVVVTDGGGVQTDHLGLSDVSCQVRQEEFVAAMAEAGAVLSEQSHVEHHDPRGGSLAAAAVREGAGDLALGAARLADREVSRSAVGRLFAAPARRSTRPTLAQ